MDDDAKKLTLLFNQIERSDVKNFPKFFPPIYVVYSD